jgi:hypothetical protein
LNAVICSRKSSSLAHASAAVRLQRALASRGWEGNPVLRLPAQLLARLAVVLVRLLRRLGLRGAVNVHVCQVTVSP